MPRPNQNEEKRRALLPVVAGTFAELGYRRTTTAELAQRCRLQENVLYRLWRDKKAMFIAAIGYVYDLSAVTWARLLSDSADGSSHAERVLAHESGHHGEFSHYRIVFAGLTETDEPEIRAALADMFRRFVRLLEREIRAHRGADGEGLPEAELSAWAIVGLGTVANIIRELDVLTTSQRTRLIADVGRFLLEGRSGIRSGPEVSRRNRAARPGGD